MATIFCELSSFTWVWVGCLPCKYIGFNILPLSIYLSEVEFMNIFCEKAVSLDKWINSNLSLMYLLIKMMLWNNILFCLFFFSFLLLLKTGAKAEII